MLRQMKLNSAFLKVSLFLSMSYRLMFHFKSLNIEAIDLDKCKD